MFTIITKDLLPFIKTAHENLYSIFPQISTQKTFKDLLNIVFIRNRFPHQSFEQQEGNVINC